MDTLALVLEKLQKFRATPRKGKEDAAKKLIEVAIMKKTQYPTRFSGKIGGASVLLKRAPEGTGVIAGG